MTSTQKSSKQPRLIYGKALAMSLNGLTWYNPPWDSNVKTNPGRKFLLIVDKCFPKNHPLNKIFNRHTLKLSYSCMPNMKAIISSHNKNMLAQDSATAAQTQQQRMCNCRNMPECPLQGSCMQENVVYQATVDTETTTENYVGLASNFKEQYRNHRTSFRHQNKRNDTAQNGLYKGPSSGRPQSVCLFV